MLIYGINPVLEALKAKQVTRLRVSARSDRRMDEVLALAGAGRVPVERIDAQALDRAARGGVHQGVVAEVENAREYGVEELLEGEGVPLLVVLDGLEDPHNVGAILRTCDAAGATGVIRQTRHAAALDGVVGKASAGALARVRIATVVNIARAVDTLKSANVWTIGLAGDADESYTDVDWTLPSALVVGAEGPGLRRLVRETCDRVVRLPMHGAVDSLNVSVAAGVVLYEAVRQRAEATERQGRR
ncbi:MAG TPA: 23S rRNA (guanosine(2251)-2'-O)-methyltransferase RlmB [Vicinamibacterales bacterium]